MGFSEFLKYAIQAGLRSGGSTSSSGSTMRLVGLGTYNGQNASGTAGNAWNYETTIPLPNGSHGLSLFFSNANNTGESALFGFTLSASILINGSPVPLTFRGMKQWTPTNTFKQAVWTDALEGITTLPTDVVKLRLYYNPGSGNQMPTGFPIDNTLGDHYSQSSTDTDQTLNTGYSWPAPAINQQFVYGPTAMRHKGSNPAVVVVGDSISAGYGVYPGDCRSWAINSLKGVVGCSVLGSPGEDTGIASIPYSHSMRDSVVPYATSVICQLIINSMIHNFDVPGTQSDLLKLWLGWGQYGAKVFQTTATPYTDGANTTPQKDAVRVPMNLWLVDGAPLTVTGSVYAAAATGSNAAGVIRAGTTGHPLTQVINVASAVEDPVTHLWKAGMLYTGDNLGAHPNSTGRDAMSAFLNPTSFPKVYS